MTPLVVDASVAVKWILPEVRSEAALRWISPERALHAPDLIYPEVGNVLWKRVRRKELSEGEARATLGAFRAVPLRVHPSSLLLTLALEVALRTQRTVYDSLYIALAMHFECPFVTADERLYNALKSDEIAGHIRWVEEAP